MICAHYDFETLGIKPETAPAACLALINFDTDRFVDDPYTFEELCDMTKFVKFDVMEQVQKHGRKIEKETLNWWMQQDEEVQKLIKPAADDVSAMDVYSFFVSNLHPMTKKVFTRRASLDQPLLISLCEKAGHPLPYGWYDYREIVSYFEGLTYGNNLDTSWVPSEAVGFKKHDPIHDVACDVLRYQIIVQALESF